jgi:sulfoxide reductase heme-binding subunit YedZ
VEVKRAKAVVFVACLAPLAVLAWRWSHSMLGSNPVKAVEHFTGTATILLLLLTLSITPIRKLAKQYWLIQYRRMFGLFAFFYGCLHGLTYFWLDQNFDMRGLYQDVAERPFVILGFAALLSMVPPAVTSTQWAIRRLGKRWQAIHRLSYFAAVAGMAHYCWMRKDELLLPFTYASILTVLLLYRLVTRAMKMNRPVHPPSLRRVAHSTSTQKKIYR